MVSIFQTAKRHGCSVKFSPYDAIHVLCASAENFSLAGHGTLFLLALRPDNTIQLVRALEWTNSLFDVSWSEASQDVCATGGGDGSVVLWNLRSQQAAQKVFKEHTKEVYSVDWNITKQPNLLLSASWDKTLKLWDTNLDNSVATFEGHGEVVYGCAWSPVVPGCFASCSGDGTLRVWDIRKSYMAQMVLPSHNAEVITCDWCKYNPNLLVGAGADQTIYCWDLRMYKQPVTQLRGHQYAVRRVKCSPFQGNTILSCSYDMTVKVWHMEQSVPVESIEHHSEFVCGIDWNLHKPGQVVDCSWDETVKLYSPQSLQSVQPTV